MIKIIKKRHVPDTVRAPAPIKVEAAPPPAPAPAPAKAKPKSDLPVAPSAEAFSLSPSSYQLPETSACSFCKHPYVFPCNGESDACMNRKFIVDRDAVALA